MKSQATHSEAFRRKVDVALLRPFVRGRLELDLYQRLHTPMQIHRLLHIAVRHAASCAERLIYAGRSLPVQRYGFDFEPFIVGVKWAFNAGRPGNLMRNLVRKPIDAVRPRDEFIYEWKMSNDVAWAGLPHEPSGPSSLVKREAYVLMNEDTLGRSARFQTKDFSAQNLADDFDFVFLRALPLRAPFLHTVCGERGNSCEPRVLAFSFAQSVSSSQMFTKNAYRSHEDWRAAEGFHPVKMGVHTSRRIGQSQLSRFRTWLISGIRKDRSIQLRQVNQSSHEGHIQKRTLDASAEVENVVLTHAWHSLSI